MNENEENIDINRRQKALLHYAVNVGPPLHLPETWSKRNYSQASHMQVLSVPNTAHWCGGRGFLSKWVLPVYAEACLMLSCFLTLWQSGQRDMLETSQAQAAAWTLLGFSPSPNRTPLLQQLISVPILSLFTILSFSPKSNLLLWNIFHIA